MAAGAGVAAGVGTGAETKAAEGLGPWSVSESESGSGAESPVSAPSSEPTIESAAAAAAATAAAEPITQRPHPGVTAAASHDGQAATRAAPPLAGTWQGTAAAGTAVAIPVALPEVLPRAQGVQTAVAASRRRRGGTAPGAPATASHVTPTSPAKLGRRVKSDQADALATVAAGAVAATAAVSTGPGRGRGRRKSNPVEESDSNAEDEAAAAEAVEAAEAAEAAERVEISVGGAFELLGLSDDAGSPQSLGGGDPRDEEPSMTEAEAAEVLASEAESSAGASTDLEHDPSADQRRSASDVGRGGYTGHTTAEQSRPARSASAKHVRPPQPHPHGDSQLRPPHPRGNGQLRLQLRAVAVLVAAHRHHHVRRLVGLTPYTLNPIPYTPPRRA